MITRPPRRPAASAGVVWHDTGTGTAPAVGDVFGPRLFPAHVTTVGYDHDFHRGVDVAMAAGDDYRSPVGGAIIRCHRTHFGFETAAQLDHWTEVDAAASATFARVAPSTLRIVGSRPSAQTFAQAGKLQAARERFAPFGGDWEIRFQLTAVALSGGHIGCGVYNGSEYVAVEYNGSVATAVGTGAGGALAANGTTRAVTTETWLRVRLSGTTLSWAVSTDATTWTNITTMTISVATFTDALRPAYTPCLYWRATDSNASAQTCDVDFVGWNDGNTIDRFGNWVLVGRGADKWTALHFQDLFVEAGDIVEAGQALGIVGLTGFDYRSGPVQTVHGHTEMTPNNSSTYDQSESRNPLAPGVLPRANVSNNVAVTVTSANDPAAVACWLMTIVVTRAAQDFDVNAITLTGNLASRTINFDTRAGLNADNDIPTQAGVYVVDASFNSAASTLTWYVYFSKAVVGSSLVSASVADTAGTVLWSQ